MDWTSSRPKANYGAGSSIGPFAQIALLLSIGVWAPPMSWFNGAWHLLLMPGAVNCLIVGILAAVATQVSLDRLRLFAKARVLSYVLPITVACFGAGFAVLGLLRLPYSSTIGLLNFVFVTLVAFALTAALRNSEGEALIVEGGDIGELLPHLPSFRILRAGDIGELIANPKKAGYIVADLQHDHNDQWESLLAEAAINGVAVYHYRQILEMRSGQVRIDHMRENNLGSLIPNLTYTGLKRVIDLAVSIVLLPVLIPVFFVVTLLIRIDSPGSVFFRQERVGYRGRTFRIFKFRTMAIRPTDRGESCPIDDAITRDSDDRITRLGGFLRRYRIDELPQVLNIIAGDMSWIGPRPEAQSLSALYQQSIPFYRYRHIVRPGITGWAQVNQGHVAAVDEVAAKLRYDFYYVRNISLWLDLLIVLKTIRTILEGFGAK